MLILLLIFGFLGQSLGLGDLDESLKDSFRSIVKEEFELMKEEIEASILDFKASERIFFNEKLLAIQTRIDLNDLRFSAYIDSGGTLTNENGVLDLIFDKIVLNTNEMYNPSNGIFRAPITGIYSFSFSGQQSMNTIGEQFEIYVEVNDSTVFSIWDTASNFAHSGVKNNVSYQWELELQEGDKVQLKLELEDTLHADSFYRLYFSGHLIKAL